MIEVRAIPLFRVLCGPARPHIRGHIAEVMSSNQATRRSAARPSNNKPQHSQLSEFSA